MPSDYNRGYWSTLRDRTRRLIGTPDDSEFLRLYKELMVSAGGFLGRNLLAMFISVAPVALIVYATLLPLERQAAATAEVVEIHAAGPVDLVDQPWRDSQPHAGPLRVSHSPGASLKFRLNGKTIEIAHLKAGTAICSSHWSCLAMALLGLDFIEVERSQVQMDGPVIARPLFAYQNPAWPYLTDISVTFYLALISGAVLVPLVRANRP